MDRAILFDIDGTLVDSAEAVTAVWREVAGRHRVSADAILRVCHGRRDEDVVPEFFPDESAGAIVRQIAELELGYADLVKPLPGAANLLSHLSRRRWAAVTSGSRPLMTARLRAAGLPVPSVLIAGEDVSRGKPDPEGYLLAARRLEVDVKSCVVVEDSPAGVAAGVAAGALVVGLSGTYRPDALVEADVVIEQLAELLPLLEKIPPAATSPER